MKAIHQPAQVVPDLGTGRSVRGATVLALLLVAAAVGPAEAKVVRFPEANPVVTLDVPDGWTVSTSPIGLQLRSPEKDSLVVANYFKGNKAAAEAWPRQAGRTMEAAGITIDKTATDKTATNQGSTNKTAAAPAPPTSAVGLPGTPRFSAPGDHFTFSGAPSISAAGGIVPSVGSNASTASMTFGKAALGSTAGNKIPHKIVTFRGGRLDGKATDVQLYVFSLASNELFLIEQQSGATDRRAVDIVYSVKAVH